MFAALTTVEPPIVELEVAQLLEGDRAWAAERQGLIKDRIRERLRDLSARLGQADWLDGVFTAADLLMVHALRRLESTGIIEEYPNLVAFIARAEARPAYQRAFAAQHAVFTGGAPIG